MFRRPFSFQGRIRRLEFMISATLLIAVSLAVGLAFAPKLPPWYAGLIILPIVWLFLVQGVKRCHGLGRSGWWMLVPFYVLWMMFASSNEDRV